MPGPFAHMVAAEQAQLKSTQTDCNLLADCILDHPEWMQAGAIGPDYPYLYSFANPESPCDWANRMHREKTGDTVRNGIWWLRDRVSRNKHADFRKAAAWLAGYLSHVIMDITVHPVVHATVDSHDCLHAAEHCRCEMVMDAHICRNRLGYELVFDEWTQNLRKISVAEDQGMDPAIKSIWTQMLRQTHGPVFRTEPPRFDDWHRTYLQAIDSATDDIIFFRHAGSNSPFVNIACDGIAETDRRQFIEHCRPPVGNRFGKINMHFDEVFAFGVDNILRYWAMMEAVLHSRGDLALPELANWDLDSGTIRGNSDGIAVLWV